MTEEGRPQPPGHFRRNCGSRPPIPASSWQATPFARLSVKLTEIAELTLSGGTGESEVSRPSWLPVLRARLSELAEAAILNKQAASKGVGVV